MSKICSENIKMTVNNDLSIVDYFSLYEIRI